MTEKIKKCSVIILNYNGKKYLKECLNSLMNQTYSDYEIIISDNGSTDGSVDFIKKSYPRIILIENGENLGYADGNNRGIRKATGDYIVILNNDTKTDKNWLKNLVEVANSDKKIAVAGGKVYWMNDPKRIQSIGGKLRKWNNFIHLGSRIGQNEIDKGQYENVINIDYALGCSFLIKKDVLKEMGLFDEKYFIYNEEIDLQYRIKRSGYKIVYSPKAKIWHLGSAVVGRETYKKIYLTQRNKMRFILKNFELYLIIWNIFSQSIHFILKVFFSLFNRNFVNTTKGIFDAIEWNLVNLKDTVKARKY